MPKEVEPTAHAGSGTALRDDAVLPPLDNEAALANAPEAERGLFKVPRVGTVAGCMVTSGVLQRGGKIRVVRDGTIVHDGVIETLKRFQDDVREVQQGFECGLTIENFNDVKEGDVLEAYTVREVARTQ